MAAALKKHIKNLEKKTAVDLTALIVSKYPDIQDEIEALCESFLNKTTVKKQKAEPSPYVLLMRQKKAEFVKDGMAPMDAFRRATKEASAEWKLIKAKMLKKKQQQEEKETEKSEDEDEDEEEEEEEQEQEEDEEGVVDQAEEE